MPTEQKYVTPFLTLKIFLVEKLNEKLTLKSIFDLKTNVIEITTLNYTILFKYRKSNTALINRLFSPVGMR